MFHADAELDDFMNPSGFRGGLFPFAVRWRSSRFGDERRLPVMGVSLLGGVGMALLSCWLRSVSRARRAPGAAMRW